MPESAPQESSLRSFLAVLRRRRVLIVGTILIGMAIAVALSQTGEKSYVAGSSVRFKDLAESLGKVGLLPTQGELPAQTSAQGAAAVTQPEVVADAMKRVGIGGSVDDAKDRITATQQAQSNLVDIDAEAPTAQGAADFANAVAAATVAAANERVQKDFVDLAGRLQDEASAIDLPKGDPNDLNTREQARLDERTRQVEELAALAAKYRALGAGVATVAEQASDATVPTKSTATSPIAAGFLGGVLGLLIALVATAVLEALDRRIHTVQELTELIQFPLIGVISEPMLGQAPLAADKDDQDSAAAANTLRMLHAGLRFLKIDDPVSTVLVTSAIPEEGKSTVAIGTALAAAARQRVLLVEADLHRPVHAKRLGLEARPGLADYLSEEASPEEVLQTLEFSNFGHHAAPNGHAPAASQLACITAGSPTRWATELIGSERFATFMEEVSTAYDLVIVDSPPLLGVAEAAEIVPRADAVLLCSRIDRVRADEVRAALALLGRLPERATGLVATGLRRSDPGYYPYAYSYSEPRTREDVSV